MKLCDGWQVGRVFEWPSGERRIDFPEDADRSYSLGELAEFSDAIGPRILTPDEKGEG